jgi:hypothetical protein
LVTLSGRLCQSGICKIDITANGNIFVQPELAEFGNEPLLPQVVKSIERQIEVLTYPQEQKDNMRFRLREALAKQAPDFIAKVFAEIAFRAMKGGGT